MTRFSHPDGTVISTIDAGAARALVALGWKPDGELPEQPKSRGRRGAKQAKEIDKED